jgi:predicted RNA-binding protein YlqC (UPF0109 family)
MKKLLEFLLEGILGKKEFTVIEETENDFVNLSIKTEPENLGMVIGRGGNTIKALRNILRVKATLEKKAFTLNIAE